MDPAPCPRRGDRSDAPCLLDGESGEFEGMDTVNAPKVTKWPFFLGDLILLGFAGYVLYLDARSLGMVAAAAVAAIAGAWLAAYPYVLEYRALARLAEADALQACTDKVHGIEEIGEQIQRATGHWQTMQAEADKVAQLAKSVAGQMAAEAQSFTEFLQKANEAEKAHLRLEIEKLRRAENDWLLVDVGILDHVHALYQAGQRSGQPALAQQLGLFQNACRDVARRVGLIPFLPNPGDAYDSQTHHLEDPSGKPEGGARVAVALAPGYTFQGRLLRPALVRLDTPATAPAPTETGSSMTYNSTIGGATTDSPMAPPDGNPSEEPRLL